MKILVTGASGFVGKALVHRLCRSHEVIALVRTSSESNSAPARKTLTMDLSRMDPDRGTLPPRIDALIHLAHFRSDFPEGTEESFGSDTNGTVRMLEYARHAGARHFVYASSGSVYGIRTGVMSEDDPPAPETFYAAVKYASELLIRPYRTFFHTCILRIFVPYGPGQTRRMVPTIIQRVLSRTPVTLVNGGHPRTNPVYIEDLVRIIEEACHLDGNHVVNVGGPKVYSIRDIASLVGALAGIDPLFAEVTAPDAYDLVGNTALMGKLFPTVEPRDMDTGLPLVLSSPPAMW